MQTFDNKITLNLESAAEVSVPGAQANSLRYIGSGTQANSLRYMGY